MMRSNDAECPICLDGMSEADVLYPLMCPSTCGYNFCLSCVEHLIASSKDDYQMASDGNRHVKVWLHCPQCRGNLTHTIKDTVILRKAKTSEKFRDVSDSELNATELRLKHEYSTLYAKDVHDAEVRLIKFHTDNGKADDLPAPLSLDEQESRTIPQLPDAFIDTSLFQGLETVMSNDERDYVQNLLISGDPENLATGAQILNGILQLTIQGMAPKNASSKKSWIEERKELEKMELFRKRYPLPARMPKYFVLNSFPSSKKMITFQDDQWDGSIADAFTRVHDRTASSAAGNKKNNRGIDNILGEAENTHLPPKARVKITSVRGQAGKLGLQKGDVVTHFGGEPFEGCASELGDLIFTLYVENPHSTFQLAVNADDCTAEVLKTRARACRKAIADIAKI